MTRYRPVIERCPTCGKPSIRGVSCPSVASAASRVPTTSVTGAPANPVGAQHRLPPGTAGFPRRLRRAAGDSR